MRYCLSVALLYLGGDLASFTLILPALNEEGGLPVVLQTIRDAGLDARVIVVNDGSTDATGDIARRWGATVLEHAMPLGAGRSIKEAVAIAETERIVMMDSDATYPVESIPLLLSTLDEGVDLVVGARTGREYNGRIVKRLARFCFRLITEFATGKRIQDINSGMRAFTRTGFLSVSPHLCHGFSLPTTMTLSYLFTGKTIAYVPIDYRRRIGSSKVRLLRDSLRTIQYITESIAHFNPLKLFLLLALAQVVAGSAASAFLGSAYCIFGLFFALTTCALGVVSLSIRRVY